jgi:putative oxidoreductase
MERAHLGALFAYAHVYTLCDLSDTFPIFAVYLQNCRTYHVSRGKNMMEISTGEPRFANSGRDWSIRAVIFLAFLFFGASKFKTDANAPWVVLYSQIGFGDWFRYLTAVIEILGGFLVLIPQTVMAGLAVLGCTMAGAVLIDGFVLHRSVDAFFPFSVLCGLIAFGLHRRRV